MHKNVPGAIRLAAVLIGLASISPFFIALDLAFRFIPDYPAFQTMRAASPFVKAAFVALGPVGVGTVFLLQRRSLAGLIACIVFGAWMYFASFALWQQRVGGIWLAAAACVFAAIGVWQETRGNASSDPVEQ